MKYTQLIRKRNKKKRKRKKNNSQRANLLDPQQCEELIDFIRPTHLLHLAWYVDPGKYWDSINNYYWVVASMNLIDKFYKFGGQRSVVAGTCAEYEWAYKKYTEYKTPLLPQTIYGTCKYSLFLMLASYASSKGLSFSWGRIFSLYGPGEHPDRLFSSIIKSLIQGNKVTCNNGELIRDYLHVSDVASAFVTLLESDTQGPINIGSGEGLKLKDLVRSIEEKIGQFGYLEVKNPLSPNQEAPVIVADNELIKSTGWSPAHDIESGLVDTINWFKEN